MKQLNVGGRTGLDKAAVIVNDVSGIKGKPHTPDQNSRKDTSRAQPGGSRCKTKKSLNKSKHSSERKVAGKLKPPGGLCREVNTQRKPLPDSTMGTWGLTEAAAAVIPGQAASKVSQTRCLSHLLLLQTYRYKSGSTVGAFTKVPASSQAR